MPSILSGCCTLCDHWFKSQLSRPGHLENFQRKSVFQSSFGNPWSQRAQTSSVQGFLGMPKRKWGVFFLWDYWFKSQGPAHQFLCVKSVFQFSFGNPWSHRAETSSVQGFLGMLIPPEVVSGLYDPWFKSQGHLVDVFGGKIGFSRITPDPNELEG